MNLGNSYYPDCLDYPRQYPNYLDNALYTNQIINACNAGYVAGSNYGYGNFRKRRDTKGVNARYGRSY
uniref:Uncharacterized protein n=1 Tax=Parastrongyloides trichosuri TaxID=131310 RepID=A0A0N5A6Q4_PARTI